MPSSNVRTPSPPSAGDAYFRRRVRNYIRRGHEILGQIERGRGSLSPDTEARFNSMYGGIVLEIDKAVSRWLGTIRDFLGTYFPDSTDEFSATPPSPHTKGTSSIEFVAAEERLVRQILKRLESLLDRLTAGEEQ